MDAAAIFKFSFIHGGESVLLEFLFTQIHLFIAFGARKSLSSERRTLVMDFLSPYQDRHRNGVELFAIISRALNETGRNAIEMKNMFNR